MENRSHRISYEFVASTNIAFYIALRIRYLFLSHSFSDISIFYFVLNNREKHVAKKLGLKKGSFSTSYQSRVTIIGSWLKPYTDKTILEFAKKGYKSIAVVTPAFVSDCLETLEEIGMEASEDFKNSGGKELYLIPCLNFRDDWVKVASNWINEWALNKS